MSGEIKVIYGVDAHSVGEMVENYRKEQMLAVVEGI